MDERGKNDVRESVFSMKQETLKTSFNLFATIVSVLTCIDKYAIYRLHMYKFTKLMSPIIPKTMNKLAYFIYLAIKRRKSNI